LKQKAAQHVELTLWKNKVMTVLVEAPPGLATTVAAAAALPGKTIEALPRRQLRL